MKKEHSETTKYFNKTIMYSTVVFVNNCFVINYPTT